MKKKRITTDIADLFPVELKESEAAVQKTVYSQALVTDLTHHCKSLTHSALLTVTDVMGDSETPPAVRLAAAKLILERGWGKLAEPVPPMDADKSARELSHAELEKVARGDTR